MPSPCPNHALPLSKSKCKGCADGTRLKSGGYPRGGGRRISTPLVHYYREATHHPGTAGTSSMRQLVGKLVGRSKKVLGRRVNTGYLAERVSAIKRYMLLKLHILFPNTHPYPRSNPHIAPALRAVFKVEAEHALEQARPAHARRRAVRVFA